MHFTTLPVTHPISRVAVVGAGAAGLTTAALLSRAGIRVEVFERRPGVDGGSGIALQANALRVLRNLDVLDEVLDVGYGFDETAIRLPGPSARVVATLTDARPDARVPAAAGIGRADLARILDHCARSSGSTVRRGTGVVGVEEDHEGVRLRLADGSLTPRFDLLVAADGLSSPVRSMIGIAGQPEKLPLGLWRVLVPRPPDLTRMEIVNGGAARLAGLCPCGPSTAYAWLTEDAQDRHRTPPAEQLALFAALARQYGGSWPGVVSSLTEDTPISYTRYTRLLLSPPWHRGRVVLVGDAVHSCPPTMAQGAAMSLEDAAVLSEMLVDAGGFDDAVLEEFARRRLPRVRAVVDGSVAIMEQQLGTTQVDVVSLMRSTTRLLAERP